MNQHNFDDAPTADALNEIQTRIQRHLFGRVRKLRLSFRDGGMVLEGVASSYYAKQLAQHAVMKCLDSSILANEIEVQ
jgi:hypothetical protein